MINALWGSVTDWRKGNTTIKKSQGVTQVYLHGSLICEFDNRQIAVSLAGWKTKTTRSRLRSLLADLGGFGSSCCRTKRVPPMMAAELTATSREMLDKTYGHLYKSEAVAASQAMLKAAEVF